MKEGLWYKKVGINILVHDESKSIIILIDM